MCTYNYQKRKSIRKEEHSLELKHGKYNSSEFIFGHSYRTDLSPQGHEIAGGEAIQFSALDLNRSNIKHCNPNSV
jgi:hypothetical protein